MNFKKIMVMLLGALVIASQADLIARGGGGRGGGGRGGHAGGRGGHRGGGGFHRGGGGRSFRGGGRRWSGNRGFAGRSGITGRRWGYGNRWSGRPVARAGVWRRGWGHWNYGWPTGWGWRRGFRFGFGVGYPWWGYRPWWYNDPVYVQRTVYVNNAQDSQGELFWEVTNTTNTPIYITAEGHKPRQIPAGATAQVSHNHGFRFSVVNDAGAGVFEESSDHYITVSTNAQGQLQVTSEQ